MKWGGNMEMKPRQQKKTRQYDDTPLEPDSTKSGDEFVEDLMKQLQLPQEEEED